MSGLSELWGLIGVVPSGIVSMQSSTYGRLVLSVCVEGRMELVVKIGGANDDKLRHEAQMLGAPLRPGLPVRRPELTWAGPWRDRFVMVTRAAHRSSSALWTVDEVIPLAVELATAGADGTSLTHGDLAPWNLVRTTDGPVLLDWEFARWKNEPMHDLAHFVVQGGALLGQSTPQGAITLLCDEGSPGAQLLDRLGLDVADARGLLADYLKKSSPTEPKALGFRAEMLRLVTA
jgi:hypothetical protein